MTRTSITLTIYKIEEINKNYDDIRREKAVDHVAGHFALELANTPHGTAVFANGSEICTVDEVGWLVDELLDMRNEIENDTGLDLELER